MKPNEQQNYQDLWDQFKLAQRRISNLEEEIERKTMTETKHDPAVGCPSRTTGYATRLLSISKCSNCCNYNWKKWGKPCCLVMDKMLPTNNLGGDTPTYDIPEWCPLPVGHNV